GVVRQPALHRERATGAVRPVRAAGGLAAVVLDRPVPDLTGSVAVDLGLDLDLAVAGLRLHLPDGGARATALCVDPWAISLARRGGSHGRERKGECGECEGGECGASLHDGAPGVGGDLCPSRVPARGSELPASARTRTLVALTPAAVGRTGCP